MIQPGAQRISRYRTFTQADFDAFAALSGDDNPIHVNPAYAAATRFGRPVAHGMLLLAVLDGYRRELFPRGRLLAHDLRFTAPTFADESVRFDLWRTGDAAAAVQVSRESDGVSTCDGVLSFVEGDAQ